MKQMKIEGVRVEPEVKRKWDKLLGRTSKNIHKKEMQEIIRQTKQ